VERKVKCHRDDEVVLLSPPTLRESASCRHARCISKPLLTSGVIFLSIIAIRRTLRRYSRPRDGAEPRVAGESYCRGMSRIIGAKFVKKIALLACLVALGNLKLLAQIEKNPRIVRTSEKSAIHQPPQGVPASMNVIYDNLSNTGTDLYNDMSGWLVAGLGSSSSATSMALPFIPRADSHVSRVRVPLQYTSGANQVNLSIYADSNGLPGALLAGPVTITNLPEFGTCCALADASFAPVGVIGGTRYWIVADTPVTGLGSDFEGVWDTVSTRVILVGSNFDGTGWQKTNADSLLAGAVLGSIP
jgi:hypothetical protein